MWLEAILSKGDLVALLPQFAPVKIRVEGGGVLVLEEPSDVALVADTGLRFSCKGEILWPVLGIKVPMSLRRATAVVRPRIAKTDAGDRLVFSLEIEKIDFSVLPELIDSKITKKVNQALLRDHVELIWDFKDTLSHELPLPAMLENLEALGLKAAWGEVRITEDALVLAVSFHASVIRSRTGTREAPAIPEEAPATPVSSI